MTAPARGSAGGRPTSEEDAVSIASPGKRTVLDRLLRYAHDGNDVLPLKRNSKAPDTRNGLKDATRDTGQIKQWYRDSPERNWGILTPARVLVLDVDDPQALPELFAAYSVLLEAPLHTTPSGGVHIFLRVPEGWTMPARVQAIPGVDVRGLGRAYVVAPPSQIDGSRYRVVRPLVPPARQPETPAELLARLTLSTRRLDSFEPRQPLTFRSEAQLRRYIWAAVFREHTAVARAPEGQRNDTLLRAAVNLAELIGPGQLAESDAHDVLVLAAEECGLPLHEAERTIANGFRYGAEHPRQLVRGRR